jgi:PKHD-type hydroxylase
MFLIIKNLLTPDDVARLREMASRMNFVDGKATNPHSQVKKNEQASYQDPLATEAAKLVMQGLVRSREFNDFAIPKIVWPPLLTRTRPGMHYGEHVDAAEIAVGQQLMRTDVSCTVFLSDPESYDGGELEARFGDRSISVKEAAGHAVVYPSNTPHQVREVTHGERLVAITFVESRVAERERRELLYDINEIYALEALKMSWENRSRLEYVQQNLRRMWLR